MSQASVAPVQVPPQLRPPVEGCGWAELSRFGPDATVDQLCAAWEKLHDHADRVSGTSVDAPQRAREYFSLYEDSRGNFMFPLVATHGSLWGVTHTQRLERILDRLRPLSRHGTIQRWVEAMDDVRDINRRVFVEIYTTFYFTRYFGSHRRAGEWVNPGVLARYNEVHAAVASGRPLSRERRRAVYYEVFVHEQHEIVDPGIRAAAEASGSPHLVRLLKRVRPRFTYFPPGESLRFSDFTSLVQRNREGLRALEFAEAVGTDRVFEAMGEY